MTPITNTPHAYTISHSFLPGRHITRQHSLMPRRMSSVLTAQELREAVQQMVD